MSNFQKILDSFSIKDTLNPKIWENPKEPNETVMISKVRKALMRIAEEFIDFLGDDVFVEDIHLTGSLANFNWSEFSDFDLHIIVNFKQYEKQSELYKELFNLKKQVFNDKHNIKIFGYDVELYAQDEKEPHYSSGVYSIMNNEWVSKPKKLKPEIDKGVLETKIKSWTEKIDTAIEEGKNLETIKTALEANASSKELIYTGITLLAIGLSFKISAVPFHFWAPDVYDGAPIQITSLMSTIVKTAAIVAFYKLFTVSFGSQSATWECTLSYIAGITILVGNIVAVYQKSAKRTGKP